MTRNDITELLERVFDAGWDVTGEGFNAEYTRPSFTREKYEAMRLQYIAPLVDALALKISGLVNE